VSEEAASKKEIQREATNRKLLGVAVIAGAIALDVLGGGSGSSTRSLRNLMIVGGTAAVASGFSKGKEAQIHVDAIKELDESFNSEVAPMVVDVEGNVVRLTGSAEAQYRNWQRMMRQIYASETGFNSDSAAARSNAVSY